MINQWPEGDPTPQPHPQEKIIETNGTSERYYPGWGLKHYLWQILQWTGIVMTGIVMCTCRRVVADGFLCTLL